MESHDSSSIPTPYKVGHLHAIKINEEIYKKSSLSCENLLLGRFFLSKGSTPPKINSLEANLISTLKIQEGLKISSLGKGFYSLKFSSLKEKAKILSLSSCKFSLGFIKFFTWKLDFIPSKKFSFTHVWVRFVALPIEYWHPQILSSIASVLGFPINISKLTLEKSFGFYAKVLIEVDLSSPLPSQILIERDKFSFVLNLSYENLPPFCKTCGFIGHTSSTCKNTSFHSVPKNHLHSTKKQSPVFGGTPKIISEISTKVVDKNLSFTNFIFPKAIPQFSVKSRK